MVPHLDTKPLFSGPLVTVFDVSCRVDHRACGCEECVAGNALVFPRAGAFMTHRGSRQFLADSNHAVFFNRDKPYRVSHPATAGDDCTVFFFRRSLIAEAFAPLYRRRRDARVGEYPLLETPIDCTTTLHIRNLRRQLVSNPEDALRAEELALQLLQSVAACSRRGEPSSRSPNSGTRKGHRDLVEAVQVLLASHFQESLSLQRIARKVGSSPFHLCRVFRSYTGTPIHQYQNRLRLAAALERIDGGEDDLTGLALDLGFSSHSHFTDSFRRSFGIPPSQYRK